MVSIFWNSKIDPEKTSLYSCSLWLSSRPPKKLKTWFSSYRQDGMVSKPSVATSSKSVIHFLPQICVYANYKPATKDSIQCTTLPRAGNIGRVTGGKIDSWIWVGTKYEINSAISLKKLTLKAGIDFSSPADICRIVILLEMCWPWGWSSPTHNYILRRQFISLHFLLMESMSPRINSTSELISHKESIPWNRCLGSVKV